MRANAWLLVGAVLSATSCSVESNAPASNDDPHAASPDAVSADATLAMRFEGAERIVHGSVEHLAASFGTNEFGDKLIVTTVTLRVEEALRGGDAGSISFQIEGGTVGELSLNVSDMPALEVGDRGVFALRRSTNDVWIPNRRGIGILLADPTLDLEGLRRAERITR